MALECVAAAVTEERSQLRAGLKDQGTFWGQSGLAGHLPLQTQRPKARTETKSLLYLVTGNVLAAFRH